MKKNESVDILNEVLLSMIYDSSKTLSENVELLSEQGGGPYYDMFGNLVYTNTGNVVDAKKVYPNITDTNKYPKKVPYSDILNLNSAFSSKALSSTIKTSPTTTYTPLTQRPGSRPQSDVLGPQGSFPRSLGVDKQSLEIKSKAAKESALLDPIEFTEKLTQQEKTEFKKEREKILKLTQQEKQEEFKSKIKQARQESAYRPMVSPENYVPVDGANYNSELSSYVVKYTKNKNEGLKLNRKEQYLLALYYPEKWTKTFNVSVIDGLIGASKYIGSELSKITITIDDFHTMLDWIGLIPGIGDFADAVNAVWFLSEAAYYYYLKDEEKARGKVIEFVLSLIAIIPVVGSVIKLGLKSIPWSTIFKGGPELVTFLTKILSGLPSSTLKLFGEQMSKVNKYFDNWIFSLSNKGIKNKAVNFVLDITVKALKNIQNALNTVAVNLALVPVVVSRAGSQLIKYSGKLLELPSKGGIVKLKLLRNLSKEACGDLRNKDNESWANQKVPENIPLIGGTKYGNLACDVISSLAWTAGPLGTLMSSTIEVENANAYYNDGEKSKAAVSLFFALIPITGLAGRGVIEGVTKQTSEFMVKNNLLYRIFAWMDGTAPLKLISEEVRWFSNWSARINDERKLVVQNLSRLRRAYNWLYINASQIGFGKELSELLDKIAQRLIVLTNFVFDFFTRLITHYIPAKIIAEKVDAVVQADRYEKFRNQATTTYQVQRDTQVVRQGDSNVYKITILPPKGVIPSDSTKEYLGIDSLPDIEIKRK